MIRIGLIAGMAVAIAGPAAAQSFFDRYIAERGEIPPCYARILDESASARRQRIQRLFVSHAAEESLRPPRTFEVAFGFTIAESDARFAGEAACETVGRLARCSVADDAGHFTLAPEGDAVQLTIGNRLALEGEQGFSPNLADGGNELILLLQPSPPESCRFEEVAGN